MPGLVILQAVLQVQSAIQLIICTPTVTKSKTSELQLEHVKDKTPGEGRLGLSKPGCMSGIPDRLRVVSKERLGQSKGKLS